MTRRRLSGRTAATTKPAETRGWLSWRSSLVSKVSMVLGAVLLVPAVLFLWAEATFFNSDGFADAASQSLQDEAVQDRIAVGLTDQIIRSDRDLARARPLIQGAAGAVIDSPQFETIFRTAVERLHERVFDGGTNELVLDLTAALTRIVELIETAAPQLAERIPPNLESGLITISESDIRTRLIRISDQVSFLAFVFPVLSLACFAGSIYLARDRRAATFRVGLALAIVAAIVVLVLLVGRWAVTESLRNPDNEPAATGIWWAWVDSLRVTMRLAGVVGIVLAAGAWWVGKKGWPWEGRLHRASAAPES